MQHDLCGHVLVVMRVSFTPIIADSVAEDVAVAVEGTGDNRPANLWMALEPMFSILVPKVEGTVATGRREGTMLRVKGDCVDGVDFCHVAVIWIIDAVAFE